MERVRYDRDSGEDSTVVGRCVPVSPGDFYHKGKFTSQDSDKSLESASEHGTLSTADQVKQKGGRRPMYCNSVFDMKKRHLSNRKEDA